MRRVPFLLRPLLRGAARVLAALALTAVPFSGISLAQTQQARIQTAFRVKYVVEGSVYLDAGSNAGLAASQKLSVRRADSKGAEIIVAELEVVSVATSSAVCTVHSAGEEIRPGDIAYLSPADVSKLQVILESKESKKYAQVVSFTEDDPLDEEVRENIPRPPSPEVNHIRGRLGFEYGSICDRNASGRATRQLGIVMRMDMTRIGGSFWNFGGYYRGRLSSRTGGTGQETLNELVNRTYHLSLTYNNPGSRWVAGVGRFYLPWASSLSTIDGGYVGHRYGKGVTVGVFGGSAPDPTSWNYDPNRQIAGAFTNYEGGSYESLRYMSTLGVALTRVNWHPDRQYGFFESGLFYKRYFSIYHNLETDLLRPSPQSEEDGLAVSRSNLTVRVQPFRFVSFDLNHNYFRNIPTFDLRLISTGLVDKLLFQGLSGGMRLDLPYRLSVYSSLGRSDKTGDARESWNQMYGISMLRIWRTGLRADFRYSRFDSSFGRGSYRALTIGREIGEGLRVDFQAGEQDLVSSLTNATRTRWINSNLDWFLFIHYFLGAGFTIYRGDVQNYNQWYLNLGYRF